MVPEAEGRAVTRRIGIAVLIGVLLAVGFLLLAQQIETSGPITDFDKALAREMQEEREHAPMLRFLFYGLTLLGAFQTMLLLVPLGALILWVRATRIIAMIWLFTGIGMGLSNTVLKHHFDRPRPGAEVRDAWVWEKNESFPSGHASSSMAMFGMLGYLLMRSSRPTRSWLLSVAITGLLILGVGFSRIYLCAHYFSDVLGGYLLGGIWLTAAVTILDLQPPQSAAGPR
jgi:undecaprenyl-diphosphatase